MVPINVGIDSVLSHWLIVKPFLVDSVPWFLLLTLRRFSTLKFFGTSMVDFNCDIVLNFLLTK